MNKLLAFGALMVLGGLLASVVAGCDSTAHSKGAARGANAATWHRLPRAPFRLSAGLTSVWTGRELVVSGLTGVAPDGNVLDAVDAAEAYNPTTRSWRRLARPPKTENYCHRSAVWTGKEMLVWGCGQLALDPLTNLWRRLPPAPSGQGIVVWTGRELIGWGGGCCGDANAGGGAYNPVTNKWRRLARSPLAPEQQPLGAWTGRELILFVSGRNPDGRLWPARLARGAAYNPATDTWRRIAPLTAPRKGASAVWDGRELLVVGGPTTASFAYNPATNRWRRLASMPFSRVGAASIWTGKRLLLWGGQTGRGASARGGLAYDPKTGRWSRLPTAPLRGRDGSAVVWTGSRLLVWGGGASVCRPGCYTQWFADGAGLALTR